jgi:hypothetical protein
MEKLYLRSNAAIRTVFTAYHRPLFYKIDWTNPFNAIIGARGVGKTTLLLQRLAALNLPVHKAIYVDLGDLYFKENRLVDFAEAFMAQGGRFLFLDEVHRYGFESWAQELKQLNDLYRHRLTIVFTGSSVVNIINQQADLSRRVRYYKMQGLSFREYLLLETGLSIDSISMEDVLQKHQQIVEDWQVGQDFRPLIFLKEYWKTGYYPYFLEDRPGYIQRLNQVVQLVIEQDIPYATGVAATDRASIARLLFAIASSPPFKPNISKLSERLSISRNTLIRYFQLLDRAELIHNIRAENKGVSVLQKPDKVYLDNPNLVYALAPQHANIEAIRETFFYNQLDYLQQELLNPPEILLPKKGNFVLKTKNERLVFEIGGPNKTNRQIADEPNAYLAIDIEKSAQAHKVPLWLFGFLY